MTQDENKEKAIQALKKSHRLVGSHCDKHPKGASRCDDCGKKKYIKTSIGEALRLLKVLHHEREQLIEEVEKMKIDYTWDNGECSNCGYNSVYNVNEHDCGIANRTVESVISLIKN